MQLNSINNNTRVPGFKAATCEVFPDLYAADPDGEKIFTALFDEKAEISNGRAKWIDQAVPIRFEHDLDPFNDKNMNTDTSSRKGVRSQISHYANVLASVQQRLFLFILVITGRKFRVLRWDRSGIVVSTAVDYVDDWKLFCDILWHISLAHRFAPELLGADPTVARLRSDDPEWKLMTAASDDDPKDVEDTERYLDDNELTELFTFKYVRKAFKETLEKGYPRYKVEVPGADKTRYFLICRPFFQAKGLAGRGTRGYVALEYDPTSTKPRQNPVDKFVFLKDAWRAKYDGVKPEGDVLGELNMAGVQYVPTLVCHGDIGNPTQETMTPQYWHYKQSKTAAPSHTNDAPPSNDPSSSTSGNLKRKRSDDAAGSSNGNLGDDGSDSDDDDAFATGCPMRSHVHYRYVVEEVGKSLTACGSGRKMLVSVVDCVKGVFPPAFHWLSFTERVH